MKEYSFEEVIANIKIGETYKCSNEDHGYMVKTIYRSEGGFRFNDNKPMDFCGINNAQKFIKEEIQVSFMDCVNSDSRCKVDYYRIKELIEEEDSSFQWLEQYQNLEDILYVIAKEFNTIACKEIIAKGKWYLEEN